MRKVLFVAFIFVLSFQLIGQEKIEAIKTSPISIGEQVEFYSEVLSENRIVNLYLPAGYSTDSLQTYPVIYLLDGSLDEDYIHIAGLVQFATFPWINILPETILVGISNVDRKRDFTYPTTIEQDKIDFPTTGGSAKFIEFIEKELQPFIEHNYTTNETKTIIGQSLGGLLATEILFKKPDLFHNYVIVSPSLWWDNESLLLLAPESYSTSKSIYVAVGKEGPVMQGTAKALHKKLVKLKRAESKNYFEFYKGQNHGDVLHLAVYHAFVKMFRKVNKI
jgi:predicted alpha/beta superfamily hydrolase